MTCPACGAAAPMGARFCPECGQRLVIAADERRLVTVLMADLVGFTALSAANDPEHIKRLVDDCFEHLVADVNDFGGRLDKIVGDEIVAQFGAPVAHEDDAERAVRCALRMHQTLTGLAPQLGVAVQMRIGVNTGEVLVGSLRAGGDPTVMGDVVNTAQRLEKLAAPGQVIVGPRTYSATRDAVRYDALGPQGLPGRDEPVEAFRAVETITLPGRRRVREQAPFVGRELEITALQQVLAMATRRRRAQVVLLSGDAGVGKSRLARELASIADREHEAFVLTGQCMPYGDANELGPIAEVLRAACDLDGVDPADARPRVAEQVAARLHHAVGSPENDRLVEGLIALIDGVARPGVDPTRARDDARRAALAYFEALTDTRPLVVIVSDLHWATTEVHEVCDRLLARLHDRPFVLIATTRPGPEEQWTPAPGRHNAFTLHVEPLDNDATSELVRALFCDDADDETVAFLLERSGGNPFFVEELVAFVQETRHDGGAVRELPATLHGLVAARLDALDPAERSVLEDCAVVGDSGPVAAVLALASRTDARRLLDDLCERDLLQLEHEEFHFKSELIREIAYGTLTKAERARRHAVVAPVLAVRGEPAIDQTAHHLATAAELVRELGDVASVPADITEQAIAALAVAAERDEAVESWLPAERHHDRILGLVGTAPSPERRRALLGRARARIHRRVLDDALTDAGTALAEARAAGDRPDEAFALTLIGEAESAAGAYDAAEATFGEALAEWRELGQESEAANVLRGLGMTHLFRGDLVQAERYVSDALGAFRAAGNQRGTAWALQNLAWISFNHGHVPQAERRLEESAELFGELGDWGGLGWAYGLLAFVRFNQGRLDEAAAIAEHIALEGQETGNRWATGMMDVLLASVALWSGRMHECVDRGRAAIALFQEIGDRWGEVMATGSVIRALSQLGRDDECTAAMGRLAEIAPQLPDEGMHSVPMIVRASVEMHRGHIDAAWDALHRIEHPADEGLGSIDELGAIGLAHIQRGDTDDAIAVLERPYTNATDDGPRMCVGSRLALAYAVAERADDARAVLDDLAARPGGTYSDRMLALWAESIVAGQSGADARAGVDAAYAIANGTEGRLDQAVAALARARVLTAIGDLDAGDALDDARDQLAALGITGAGWEALFDRALAGVRAPERP